MGVCLEAWGTYLLSQDKPVEAGKLLTRALKVSKEVLGEEHEQVRVGTYFFFFYDYESRGLLGLWLPWLLNQNFYCFLTRRSTGGLRLKSA